MIQRVGILLRRQGKSICGLIWPSSLQKSQDMGWEEKQEVGKEAENKCAAAPCHSPGVGWEVLDLGMWLFLCTLPSQVPDLCVSDLNMSFSSSHQNVWCPSEHL